MWHPGETQIIRWVGAGPIDIYFSPDGNTFQLLVSNVSGGSYSIIVPQVYTENAVMKISRDSFPPSVDFSDGSFSIIRQSTAPVGKFHDEVVDAVGGVDYGTSTSMALDANGNPHISYYDGTNYDLKYTYRSGGSWHTEVVDTTGNVGLYTSLALDISGNPHISYYDSTNQNLKYAYKAEGIWHIETVDATGAVGGYTSITLDANSNPHISYRDYTHYRLKYAYKAEGIWHTETVDTSSYADYDTSIEIDGNGNPCISYYDYTGDNLKYAYKSGGTWHIETADGTGNVGLYSSLDLDASGNPHISYFDWFNNELKYAYKSGGSWHIETVDTTGAVGYFTSLSLDASGNPHISYYDGINSNLKYAYKSGGSWHIETVDTTGNVGWYTSLALDANGNPHISYLDHTSNDLKYATTAISLFSPRGGETWNVGANATLRWGGPRDIDVYISLQGGDDWQSLLTGISGTAVGDTWQYSFQVPHIPTHYAKLKVVYESFDQNEPLNYSVSDTFFTIQATVTLLEFNAEIGNDGKVHLTWQTDPGPQDLVGYHLYRLNADGSELKLTSSPVQETAFTDDPVPGIRGYALSAVNGLGTEYRVGEISLTALRKPIIILPTVVRDRAAIYYNVPSFISPDNKQRVKLYITDVTGRVVMKLLDKRMASGIHVLEFNRKEPLQSGTYFLVLQVNDEHQKTARFQVIR